MSTALVGGSRLRVPDLAALVLVGITVFAGPVVYSQLPAEMVIGWRLGLDGQVALTHGPRLVGLALVPALSIALLAATRAVRRMAALEPGTTDRRVFDGLTTLLLAGLCATQLAMLWLNL